MSGLIVEFKDLTCLLVEWYYPVQSGLRIDLNVDRFIIGFRTHSVKTRSDKRFYIQLFFEMVQVCIIDVFENI